MVSLEAETACGQAFVRKALGSFVSMSLLTVPVGVAILIVDYRLILLSILVFACPLLAIADALRVRRLFADGGSVRLSCGADAAAIAVRQFAASAGGARAPVTEELTLPYPQIVARVTPDRVVVTAGPPTLARVRVFVIPGAPDATREVGELLRARGARVAFERGGAMVIAALLGGALLQRFLVVGATGCVLGAFANIGLAASGSGGSYRLGGALLGAALVLLTLASVLRRHIRGGEG